MADINPQDPQSANQYDDRTTVAVKSVLVEIGQILGSFQGKYAVIGGAVPWLLLGNLEMPHVGTIDVDLSLDAEALGALPQERRRMLALERPCGVHPCRLQRVHRHDLDIVAVRVCRRMQIADVIHVTFLGHEPLDHLIYRRRIYERTIGGDLCNRVRSFRSRRLVVPVQQIRWVPAEALDRHFPAYLSYRIVARIGRRCHYKVEIAAGAKHTLDHPLKQRSTGQRHKHLIWSPRRGGPCLNDNHDFHF